MEVFFIFSNPSFYVVFFFLSRVFYRFLMKMSIKTNYNY